MKKKKKEEFNPLYITFSLLLEFSALLEAFPRKNEVTTDSPSNDTITNPFTNLFSILFHFNFHIILTQT